MQIDSEQLRQYYASLSDESLLALDRDELTEVALQIYDEELADRNLETEGSAEPDSEAGDAADIDEPDWLAEAGCACTFATGHRGHEGASDAEHARVVLEAAGIPCHLVTHSADDDPKQRYEYRVMVPGNLTIPAASILDKEIFNVEVEAEWRIVFRFPLIGGTPDG